VNSAVDGQGLITADSADQNLPISSFLLWSLDKKKKNNVVLNLCNSMHTVKSKKKSLLIRLFPEFIVATRVATISWKFHSADRLFRRNFRPLRRNIFTQNLTLCMYCNVIFTNITKRYQFIKFPNISHFQFRMAYSTAVSRVGHFWLKSPWWWRQKMCYIS
jgi:hypothetical protein